MLYLIFNASPRKLHLLLGLKDILIFLTSGIFVWWPEHASVISLEGLLGRATSKNVIFLFVCEVPVCIYWNQNWLVRGSGGFLCNIGLSTGVLRLMLLMDCSLWDSLSMVSPLKISSEELLGFWLVVMTIFQVPKWCIAGDLLTEQTWSNDVCQGAKDCNINGFCPLVLFCFVFFLTVDLVFKAEKKIWDTVNSKLKKG